MTKTSTLKHLHNNYPSVGVDEDGEICLKKNGCRIRTIIEGMRLRKESLSEVAAQNDVSEDAILEVVAVHERFIDLANIKMTPVDITDDFFFPPKTTEDGK